MSEADDGHRDFGWPVWAGRIGIGLVQGLALWGLIECWKHHLWPATQPTLYAAVLLAAAFGPLIIHAGLGRMRPLTLAVLTVALALCAAAFAWHDVARQVIAPSPGEGATAPTSGFAIFLFSAAFMFIGHHLAAPADAARRWIAPYQAYFDTAWKNAVQLALSLAFVGVLWAALLLGAQLFKLIGIHAFADLIQKSWFALPVTTTAFAAAVQLTDVRIGLIRGIRTVGLVLLSWLLPLMTVIAAAFLVALPFTGLRPLFATKTATAILLSAAAALIILINAAYQDGEQKRTPVVLRLAARLASVCLIPLIAIAAYALFQRVNQYGWTPERIEATACVVVGAGYAIGYTVAASGLLGPWMKPLERVNVGMALLAMAAIFVLFTPIADPARLSVDDQVGRLLSGSVTPEKFDYRFLRFDSGRYGREALDRLRAIKGAGRNAIIALSANAALQAHNPWEPVTVVKPLIQRLTVFPAGAVAPQSFIDQAGVRDSPISQPVAQARCQDDAQSRCDLYLLDIDGDHVPEVLLTPNVRAGDPPSSMRLQVFKQAAGGAWGRIGDLVVECAESSAAMRKGEFQLVKPKGFDVQAAGNVYSLQPDQPANCATH